ncbi:MAG: PQQ-like beta-propeller repeat protein, partial [Gammaproteobacteria bacterium]|nr:PQQ-like beta-propeller repeat protein [Gammaproteobacteria bacterium]
MKRLLICLSLLFSLDVHAETGWEFDVGGMVAGDPVVHGDRIYATGGTRLVALNRAGELQWSYDAQASSRSSVAIGGETVFVLADNGLHALDREGNRQWLFETQDSARTVEGKTMGWGEGRFEDPWAWTRSAPLLVDDRVIFGNANGTHAVSARDGTLIWHADTGVSHTRPSQADGVVIIGSWDNHLHGLKLADGSVAWKIQGRLPQGEMAGWLGWEGFHLDPVIDEGVAFVGSRGTYYYAIDVKTGTEKWSGKHPSSWIGSPAIVDDGVVYLGLSDGYSLIGLKTRNGNQTLLFRNNFYNFARPQADSSRVFLASLSGELHSIDKKTGTGRTLFATPKSKDNLQEVLYAEGGQNFVHSAKGGFTHENAVKDVHRMLTELDSLVSLTLDGGVLYAGSAGGRVYAIP